MKRIRLLLVAIVLVGLIGYFVLPAFLFPSGTWYRRVVRKNPLKDPVAINAVRSGTLVSGQQEFSLAGVRIPTDGTVSSRADEFLRVVTAQGIEVVRVLEPSNTFILRCEPRIWHWCGNDPIKAYYEQFNLNELLLAFGYATFDSEAIGLTDKERLRLMAAENVGKERTSGVWNSASAAKDRRFRAGSGLSISEAMGLKESIELSFRELQKDE